MEKSEPGVVVSAVVSPDLARQVRALAEAGNRSVSREITAAIREHVEAQQQGTTVR
jgi:predicted transcriptional regulator